MAKKTKRTQPKKAESAAPPIGRLNMDQTMAGLQKLLAGQDFASADEANAFLQQTLQAHGGFLPQFEPETPLEQAEALVAQAYELSAPNRQRALARQALDLSPDCADAYVLLAGLEPEPMQNLALLEQAVAAGRRALGEAQFKELEGSFWGFVQTRPFMRAYAGLAELTWVLGDRARALGIYADLLRLNPMDNQGVRYMLATSLLEERTSAARTELQALLDRFPDDAAANWAYSRALLFFQREGQANDTANAALHAALKVNPHVPPLLLGEKQMPREMPQFIGMGDLNEAVEYLAFAHDAWRHTSGALLWLRGQRRA